VVKTTSKIQKTLQRVLSFVPWFCITSYHHAALDISGFTTMADVSWKQGTKMAPLRFAVCPLSTLTIVSAAALDQVLFSLFSFDST
jgi:hypothetical protein